MFLCPLNRQQHGKSAATSNFAFNPNLSVVGLNQAAGNRQAQAHTTGFLRLNAQEFIEYFKVKFRRDSRAIISYGDFY